ncbi:hypothetical protein Afil01_26560 [Actinorhabdospora filicis]|uniref:Uncharacterized protein n=1 Tax=Actinorhabdospora filicis TaxID=1785913 RepID=A0A9W6SIT4_9ACTN|nr:hypothetical protein [Actinorhabdospora filicis]GLZ77849.1 hypothetical protein Afil01_26560 [Actinorhabdospora filicis]
MDQEPSRPTRSPTDYVMVALLLAAVVLVVIGAVKLNTKGEEAAPPPVAVRTPEPPTLGDLGATCLEQPRAWPGAADYLGNGPHPIAIFDSGYPTAAKELSDLGEGWHAATAADAQLIVCVGYRLHEQIKVCRFTGNGGEKIEAKVFAVDYLFRIFTARTGAQLGSDEAFTDEFTCPTSVVYVQGNGPSFMATLPKEKVQAILAQWVTPVIG